MKKILVLGALVGILLALSLPAIATKFTFDLSKGPVSFSYSTIGAHNPITITLLGENGTVRTWFASEYYQSQTMLQAVNKLLMTQHGAVPWTDLSVESLTGKLSLLASTKDGVNYSVKMEGAQGNVTVRLETSGMGTDTSDKEVSAAVQVDAEAGKLTIKDSSPRPNGDILASQKHGMPQEQMTQFLNQFGRTRVNNAFRNADSHTGLAVVQGTAAGGGGSIAGDGSVSFADLSSGEVFRISLWGLKYQGYLKNSTLYMRLLSPANGVSIRDMRVILTVVRINPSVPLGEPHIVRWDVFPYDNQAQCYLYRLKTNQWKPGTYEIYIDVGRILNFTLPVTVTTQHEVLARR